MAPTTGDPTMHKPPPPEPRMDPETSRAWKRGVQPMERMKTGIAGLDAMLQGGFLPQTANLVEGAPGTGKSVLGMQFIYNGIVHYDEPGLILTFETFPRQYYRDALNFGWDFRQLERENRLRILMSSPEVSKADLEQLGGMIEGLVDEMGARRILVDSLSHFERLTDDPVELRGLVYSFINGLKREGLTAVLTRESPAILGEGLFADEDESIAFVVDSYILLRYVEMDSAVHRALLVLKLRGSDHAKEIRRFEITASGIRVMDTFKGREGIMSGSPRRMPEAFIEAFIRHP
ncbi:MAG: ATPase [Chloroflexi bacterium]|nr:MAG: ATPase [Chloroflexota bacterium]